VGRCLSLVNKSSFPSPFIYVNDEQELAERYNARAEILPAKRMRHDAAHRFGFGADQNRLPPADLRRRNSRTGS
jgi:hypothetical protein